MNRNYGVPTIIGNSFAISSGRFRPSLGLFCALLCFVVCKVPVVRILKEGSANVVPTKTDMLYELLKLKCFGNDHTSMTAPLPVCSAKLSMLGLS